MTAAAKRERPYLRRGLIVAALPARIGGVLLRFIVFNQIAGTAYRKRVLLLIPVYHIRCRNVFRRCMLSAAGQQHNDKK